MIDFTIWVTGKLMGALLPPYPKFISASCCLVLPSPESISTIVFSLDGRKMETLTSSSKLIFSFARRKPSFKFLSDSYPWRPKCQEVKLNANDVVEGSNLSLQKTFLWQISYRIFGKEHHRLLQVCGISRAYSRTIGLGFTTYYPGGERSQ